MPDDEDSSAWNPDWGLCTDFGLRNGSDSNFRAEDLNNRAEAEADLEVRGTGPTAHDAERRLQVCLPVVHSH